MRKTLIKRGGGLRQLVLVLAGQLTLAGSRARRKARKEGCRCGCVEEVFAPPIQEMKSAVVWPCVHCGGVDAVRVFIVGLPVDTSVRIGVLEAQKAALWAWSGPSLLVQLPAEVYYPGFGP